MTLLASVAEGSASPSSVGPVTSPGVFPTLLPFPYPTTRLTGARHGAGARSRT